VIAQSYWSDNTVFIIAGIAIFIGAGYLFWVIAKKAGFTGRLGLLALVPVVNLVAAFAFAFAFAEWPIERDNRSLRKRVKAHKEQQGALEFARSSPASIHATSYVDPASKLTPSCLVGPHTRINGPCEVRGEGPVEIGAWCAIGHYLFMLPANHGMNTANVELRLDRLLGLPRNEANPGISIGNAVWIGDRVTIVAGARIGNGAVVGAGAVVAGELPPYSVAVGVPARVKRFRFPPQVCELIDRTAWWEWGMDRISANRAFLSLDLTTASVAEIESTLR
jgi:virginiamycin A acetyltransferase